MGGEVGGVPSVSERLHIVNKAQAPTVRNGVTHSASHRRFSAVGRLSVGQLKPALNGHVDLSKASASSLIRLPDNPLSLGA